MEWNGVVDYVDPQQRLKRAAVSVVCVGIFMCRGWGRGHAIFRYDIGDGLGWIGVVGCVEPQPQPRLLQQADVGVVYKCVELRCGWILRHDEPRDDIGDGVGWIGVVDCVEPQPRHWLRRQQVEFGDVFVCFFVCCRRFHLPGRSRSDVGDVLGWIGVVGCVEPQ